MKCVCVPVMTEAQRARLDRQLRRPLSRASLFAARTFLQPWDLEIIGTGMCAGTVGCMDIPAVLSSPLSCL